MTRGRDPWLAVAFAVSLILIALVVLPQLWLLRASLLAPNGSPTLANFALFFSEARYLAALRNSVVLSILVCAFAMAIADPLLALAGSGRNWGALLPVQMTGRVLVPSYAPPKTIEPSGEAP